MKLHFHKLRTIILLAAIVLLTACNRDPRIKIRENYLYLGNEDAQKVIVVSQGGPSPELTTDDIEFALTRDVLKNAQIVVAHQYQTKYPDLFSERIITFEESKSFNNKAVEILQNVITEFKEKNKKVYLIGISYGAFIAENYLATYGIDALDGVGIIVGRLDFEEEFWQAFSNGETMIYENGTTIVPALSYNEVGMGGGNEFLSINMPKMAAGSGYKNYLEELKDLDFENIIYAYGTSDPQVGRLREDEVAFLKEKNATIIKVDGGQHIDTMRESLPVILSRFYKEK